MAIYRKYRKYSGKNRRVRKRGVIKKAVRRANKSAFKKKVLAVLHQQAETKAAFLAPTYQDYNSAISLSGDASRLIPNISIGTGDNARVGDQIRAQSIVVRGAVELKPQTNENTYDNRKIAVRLMVLTPKSYPTWDRITNNTSSWMPTILKTGGVVKGFDGLTSDLFAPINTDAVTCHYNKVIYLNQPGIYSTGSGTNVAMTSVDQGNMIRFFKIKLRCKNKLLKYDSNIDSGLTPSNYSPVLCIGYALMDPGASPDTVTTRVRAFYTVDMKYEDS